MIELRPLAWAAGLVSAGVAIGSQLADPEVLSALAAVVWRAEDIVNLPEWVTYAVFVTLVIVLLDTARKKLATRGEGS